MTTISTTSHTDPPQMEPLVVNDNYSSVARCFIPNCYQDRGSIRSYYFCLTDHSFRQLFALRGSPCGGERSES